LKSSNDLKAALYCSDLLKNDILITKNNLLLSSKSSNFGEMLLKPKSHEKFCAIRNACGTSLNSSKDKI